MADEQLRMADLERAEPKGRWNGETFLRRVMTNAGEHTVTVWIGRRASARDRRALEAVVESLRFRRPA